MMGKLYGGMCPKCLGDLTDGICLHCLGMYSAKSAIFSCESRIVLPDDALTQRTVPISEPEWDLESTRQDVSPGPNASDEASSIDFRVAAECGFIGELVTNRSMNPLVAVIEFNNLGGEALAYVVLECEDEVYFRKNIIVAQGRSQMQVNIAAGKLRSDQLRYVDMTMMVSVEGVEILNQSSTVVVRPMGDLCLDDFTEQIPRWITPNAMEIKDLLSADGVVTREILALGMKSVHAYQEEKVVDIYDCVMDQAEGIYNALLKRGLKYVMCPSECGRGTSDDRYQSVKLPREVLRTGCGICIDLTCLFASIIEAIGIFPILLFPKGHAMPGMILSSKCIPGVPYADFSGMRFVKVLDVPSGSGKMDTLQVVFFESTLVCSGHSFKTALESADMDPGDLKDLVKDGRYTVVYSKRRYQNIMPMASRFEMQED